MVSSRMRSAISFWLLGRLDEAPAVGDLAAGEEIAPQRLLLAQRLLLIDRLDAAARGPAAPSNPTTGGSAGRGYRGRPEVGRCTPVTILIRVDLPAPLSPTRPTISLLPTAKSTLRSA